MSEPLRVCCFDRPGPDGEIKLRAAFQAARNLLLIGEARTWEELRDWIRHERIDLVVVNLDTSANHGIDIIQHVVDFAPTCSIIGISHNQEPSFIIAAMRAGCTQFVTSPVDDADLNAALDRIRATRVNVARSSKRICVIGSSGGAGATTIACNLAIELSHLTEQQIGLVDMNLEFGDVACSFDCDPSFTISDVCGDDVDIDRILLTKAIHSLPCGVALMPRPYELEEARTVSPDGVKSMLQVMGTMYRHVVVDLPRMTGFLSAAAVDDADHVLIVTQLGVPFIRNATRIYNALLQMGADEHRIEIVLNRYQANYARISPEEVEAHFKRPVLAMIPNDYQHVQSAIDLGHPIKTDAPKSSARLAIHEMATRLATPESDEDEASMAAQPSPGLLRRLLGAGGQARS